MTKGFSGFSLLLGGGLSCVEGAGCRSGAGLGFRLLLCPQIK